MLLIPGIYGILFVLRIVTKSHSLKVPYTSSISVSSTEPRFFLGEGGWGAYLEGGAYSKL